MLLIITTIPRYSSYLKFGKSSMSEAPSPSLSAARRPYPFRYFGARRPDFGRLRTIDGMDSRPIVLSQARVKHRFPSWKCSVLNVGSMPDYSCSKWCHERCTDTSSLVRFRQGCLEAGNVPPPPKTPCKRRTNYGSRLKPFRALNCLGRQPPVPESLR